MKLLFTGAWIAAISLTSHLLVSPARHYGQEPVSEAATTLARFRVAKDGDALLLPVRLKGKDYLFLFDTGMTHSAFELALPLGEPIQMASAQTTTRPTQVTLYKAPEATIGPLPFELPGNVVGFDFSKIRQVSGHPIYGVIGMDFLSKHIVAVDFDRGELAFLKPSAPKPGKAVRLIRGGDNRPYVPVQVLGQTLEFVIDSGYIGLSSGWLDHPFFALNLLNKGITPVGAARSTDLAGDNELCIGQVSEMSLGDFRLAAPCLSEGSGHALILHYLTRFNVVFDFPANTMYLTKSKQFDRPDQWDRSGLHLLRDNGKSEVHSVDRGSTGARVGIKAGDELVSVAGQKAAELTMFEIRRRLATPGATVPLVIRRAAQDYQTQLKLEDSASRTP